MDANEIKEISSVLRTLWQTYTPDLLLDTRRVNALLMDYLPQYAKERRLIVSVLREGIASDLLAVRDADSEARQRTLNRWVHRLSGDLWITESASRFAVETLADSLGVPAGTANAGPQPSAELIKGSFTGQMDPDGAFLQAYEGLGYKALACAELTELTLPDTIRRIRPRAFLNCRRLSRVVLPAQLEAIGREAFRGCWSLSELSVSGNTGFSAAGGMLVDRSRNALLRAVRRPAGQIPHRVETICSYAFDRSEIRELQLPKQLQTIEPAAFFLCQALERVEIDRANPVFSSLDGVLHSRDRRTLLYYPAGRTDAGYILEETVTAIADSAFEGAFLLQTVTMTDTLQKIGRRAFRDCRRLQSVILPCSVETIGERAFQGCTGLKSVMLSRGIRDIGDCAFQDCGDIRTLSIPRNVERIGHAAFAGCRQLQRIILQDRIRLIGDGAFWGCPADFEIAVKGNPYVETYCQAHGIRCVPLS